MTGKGGWGGQSQIGGAIFVSLSVLVGFMNSIYAAEQWPSFVEHNMRGSCPN